MELINQEHIENRIFTIRNMQVMLDRDLAGLYQVETKVLNQAVKRNIDRFPDLFRFQLTQDEAVNLMSQNVTTEDRGNSSRSQFVTLNTKRGHNIKYLPYTFMSDLIKKAKKEVILIDNYIDESVLTLLSKRQKDVTAILYTKSISKALQLDLEKHHTQYPEIQVKSFAQSHDRFLLIDQADLYHIGASLKDLGKKWFAFSRMDSMTALLLNQLKNVR